MVACFALGLLWIFTPVFAERTLPITHQTLLPVDQAFLFEAKLEGHTLIAEWTIQEGYYLYRKHFDFSIQPSDRFKLGNVIFPPPLQDKGIGEEDLYAGRLILRIPIVADTVPKSSGFTFVAQYQGCAKTGLCYPPVEKRLHFVFSNFPTPHSTLDSKALTLLSSHNILWTVLAFLGVGVLLSLTPCVLPMIPILSSIIVMRASATNSKKAFLLSLTYVTSLATTFAVAGVVASAIGFSIQAALQNPWVIGFLSFLFMMLAASMLGLFELKLPKKLHYGWMQFHPTSNGRFLRAVLLGAVSSLVVSPCVTPVLAGALLYIGQSGNFWLGGTALGMMGLGMGIPLLVLGTFEGALLPKAGPWTRGIKTIFGFLLLAVTIELLARIVPPSFTLLLWALLCLMASVFAGVFSPARSRWQKVRKALACMLFVYSMLLMVGALLGNTAPFKPLENFRLHSEASIFHTIYTEDALKKELSLAKQDQKAVIVTLYAAWCTSCQTMEKKIFRDPAVREALKDFVVLRVDVTSFDKDSRRLMELMQTFAPPAFLFYNANGEEQKARRAYGIISRDAFLKNLAQFKEEIRLN
ncbi:MAG: protein-disulfide reductase DsbD [Gammaproteobacteria bacterium]|nr:protein-disulfide reductase DsbD [Gammaproteobacteria bacterium]